MAIKADATLVQAALYEGKTGAMADVPNLKPLYESTAEISETAMGTVTGIMDQIKLEKELEDIAKEKRVEPINKAAKAVHSALYDGGEPLPEIFINAFEERIEALQAEFEKVNTEGKGDTKANARKRREINGEFLKLKNEATNVRANFMISTQDPDKWNVGRIDDDHEGDLLSIFGLWTDPKKSGGITSNVVNGKLEVTVNGNVWNSESILKALNYKDAKNDQFVIGGVENSGQLGKEAATAPNADGKSGTYYNDVTVGREEAEIVAWLNEDPGRYGDISGRRIDGLDAASFKNGLRDRIDIPFAVLDRMFVNENGTINTELINNIKALDKSGKDGKPDGIINSEDMKGLEGDALKKFNKNFDLITSAILDPKDENFNKELSYKMLAEYHVGLRKQNYEDSYKAQWEADHPSKIKTPEWEAEGFSDYGKWKDYHSGVTKNENRNVEFQLFMGKNEDGKNLFEKNTVTSDELVNLDTQLSNLMNQSSFDTENYVNVFGKKVGYFPGKGFAPVKIRDDGQLTRKQRKKTKMPKGGYWKNPKDVFQHYSIPTTYSKKIFYEGQEETHKDGRPIIFKGGKWVYND